MEKTEVVEKRVKSTVIRRRREVVAEAPESVVKAAFLVEEKISAIPSQVVVGEKPIKKEDIVETKQAAEAAKTTEASKQPEKRIIDLSKFNLGPKKAPVLASADPEIVPDEETEEEKKNRLKRLAKKKGPRRMEIEGFGEVSSITQLSRIAHTERVFQPDKAGKRNKRGIVKKSAHRTPITETKASKRIVEMTKNISAGDLAKAMGIKSAEIIKKLMALGTMATVNQMLDFETATVIAGDYKFEVRDVGFNENKVFNTLDQKTTDEGLIPRAPVVTIMGHVDHGKTSLLDAIRKSKVAEGEAGGITQHIGAYTVALPKGKITFLDTPGHEAFTTMRARGASVTDIVVLVVAADDGMMPQTVESIHHAKAAGVPIVVAVNKIDKPGADPEKIKRQLSEKELIPEEWGGQTLVCMVSAKTKQGIDELLETILLQAEVLELRADPKASPKGIVVEAKLDRNRGPLATILVQQGTLRMGDIIVAGMASGKIRAMTNYLGKNIEEAGPSTAVEIMGLDSVPVASDVFRVVPDEKMASEIVENRRAQKREEEMAKKTKVSLEDFFAQSAATEVKVLNVILKTDVHGSLEAIKDSLLKLSTEKVKINLIHTGVGGITESDVLLASASGAVVMGFNVRPETKAIGVAQGEGVDIKLYKIIYEMMEDVKLAMKGMLAPKKIEKYLGRAEVRQTFTVSKVGNVAGCHVVDGKLTRSANLRLLRDNVVVFEGKVSTLKRFKDDAREVTQGLECGVGIEGYNDIKPGDLIEAFDVTLVQPDL